jgi:hypothetical protein
MVRPLSFLREPPKLRKSQAHCFNSDALGLIR